MTVRLRRRKSRTEIELETVQAELAAEGHWGGGLPQGCFEISLGPGRSVEEATLTDVLWRIREDFHSRRPDGLANGVAWPGYRVLVTWNPNMVPPALPNEIRTR